MLPRRAPPGCSKKLAAVGHLRASPNRRPPGHRTGGRAHLPRVRWRWAASTVGAWYRLPVGNHRPAGTRGCYLGKARTPTRRKGIYSKSGLLLSRSSKTFCGNCFWVGRTQQPQLFSRCACVSDVSIGRPGCASCLDSSLSGGCYSAFPGDGEAG